MKYGSRQKLREKLKTSRIEWKWVYDIQKSMEHNEDSSMRQVHDIKCLH